MVYKGLKLVLQGGSFGFIWVQLVYKGQIGLQGSKWFYNKVQFNLTNMIFFLQGGSSFTRVELVLQEWYCFYKDWIGFTKIKLFYTD